MKGDEEPALARGQPDLLVGAEEAAGRTALRRDREVRRGTALLGGRAAGKGGLGMTKAAKHSPAVSVSATSRSAPSPACPAQPGRSCGVSDHRESLLPLPAPGLLGHVVFKGHSQRTLQ